MRVRGGGGDGTREADGPYGPVRGVRRSRVCAARGCVVDWLDRGASLGGAGC